MFPFYLKYAMSCEYRSGFSSIHLLDFNVNTVYKGLTFPNFSPIYETFNERIGNFIANGLISYWHEMLIDPKGIKITEDKIGPQVLTLDHLEICFQACLIPAVLSLIAFLYEITTFKLKVKYFKLIDCARHL